MVKMGEVGDSAPNFALWWREAIFCNKLFKRTTWSTSLPCKYSWKIPLNRWPISWRTIADQVLLETAGLPQVNCSFLGVDFRCCKTHLIAYVFPLNKKFPQKFHQTKILPKLANTDKHWCHPMSIWNHHVCFHLYGHVRGVGHVPNVAESTCLGQPHQNILNNMSYHGHSVKSGRIMMIMVIMMIMSYHVISGWFWNVKNYPQLLWTPISDSASLASWNWQAIPPRDSPWLSVNSRCDGACSLCGLCQPQRFMMVHVFHGILLRNGKWHGRPAESLWLYGFPWVPHRFHRHGNDQLAILPMSRLSPRLWWNARKAIPGMSEVMSEVISDMSEFKPG